MSLPLAYIDGRFGRIGLVEMDTSLAVHVHHHVHLVAKAGGADTVFQVRGRAIPVTTDRAALVEAWAPHGWAYRRGAAPTLFLTFYLEPDWVRDRIGFGSLADEALFAEAEAPLDRAAQDSLRALAGLLAANGPCGAAAERAGIDDMVAALLSSVVAPRRRPGRPVVRARLQDHRIRRAFAMLRGPQGGEIDRVAREVGLSRPRFFELFRECTGLTPGCVANAGRMERAIQGLTYSRTPLGGLALDLGYASQGNFTRFFKQQIGISPTSYRRAVTPAGLLPWP